MDNLTTKNAIITGTRITNSDHDDEFLSIYIELKADDDVDCTFGGNVLLNRRKISERGLNYCGIFINKVLEIAGCEDWDKLKGKAVRVKVGHYIANAIGHINKNSWFYPEKYFRKLERLSKTTRRSRSEV